MAQMEGSGYSLWENGINPCIWAYLGSARAGEFPTLCSPAAHGRYSRVQQTAAGRLGEETEMQLGAEWRNLPASHPSLMGQKHLAKMYKSPHIIELQAESWRDLGWDRAHLLFYCQTNREAERRKRLSRVAEQLRVNPRH